MPLRNLIKLTMALLFVVQCAGRAHAVDVVVFGGESFQPQIYMDNGKPAGILPKMFARLSRDTGDNYKLVLLPWKRAISESMAGHGGITSFSWTRERAQLFDYSDPVLISPIYVTVLKARASEFRSLNDLKGKVVGMPLGSSFGGTIEKMVAEKSILIDPDSTPESRIKKLLYGRIDAALIGGQGLRQTIKSDSFLMANQDKLVTLPFSLDDDFQYLAFPKSMHMQYILERFNKALSALKKTGEYQKIIDDNTPH